MRLIFGAAICAVLCGCAGRAPAPVQVVQATDRYMDCTAILAEVQANNEKVKQLAADKGMKTAQNVAAGVAGIVIPVLWFGMDFQGTADAETTALQSRQQYLAMLADQKRCGADSEPPLPSASASPKPHRAKQVARPITAPGTPTATERPPGT